MKGCSLREPFQAPEQLEEEGALAMVAGSVSRLHHLLPSVGQSLAQHDLQRKRLRGCSRCHAVEHMLTSMPIACNGYTDHNHIARCWLILE